MVKWKKKLIHLGEIPANKKQKVIFKAVGKFEVERITSSCSCSTPKLNLETNELSVEYTPSSVPVHLKAQGFYNSIKTITVYNTDGSKDLLTIKAKVYG